MTHPARFSPELVAVLRTLLLEQYPDFWARPQLHDPLAGTGERLAVIAGDEFNYSGTELEESFILNTTRIKQGDATNPSTYPTGPYVIVTSPVYPNGIADHAVSNDASRRNTYRKAIETIEGADRELHMNNQGRYGYRGTAYRPPKDAIQRFWAGKPDRRGRYWVLADQMVYNWAKAERVYVNVSDFVHSGDQIEPVVSDWAWLLSEHGWFISGWDMVETQRLRFGANHEKRVASEVILVGEREATYTAGIRP